VNVGMRVDAEATAREAAKTHTRSPSWLHRLPADDTQVVDKNGTSHAQVHVDDGPSGAQGRHGMLAREASAGEGGETGGAAPKVAAAGWLAAASATDSATESAAKSTRSENGCAGGERGREGQPSELEPGLRLQPPDSSAADVAVTVQASSPRRQSLGAAMGVASFDVVRRGKDLDTTCRWLFPLAYALFLVIFLLMFLLAYGQPINCHETPYY